MEPPSKVWMMARRQSNEYLEGIDLFFQFVSANTHKLGVELFTTAQAIIIVLFDALFVPTPPTRIIYVLLSFLGQQGAIPTISLLPLHLFLSPFIVFTEVVSFEKKSMGMIVLDTSSSSTCLYSFP